MKKDLQVSFKIGNGQEVWIQHPALSKAIHAEQDHEDILTIAHRLAQHLDCDFEYFDLDRIGEWPVDGLEICIDGEIYVINLEIVK